MGKRWIRPLLVALSGTVVSLLAAIIVLNVISVARQRRIHMTPPVAPPVSFDAAAVDRGRHLVTAVSGCTDCHASDLGGQVVMDKPLVGRFVGPNLTRGLGGIGEQSSDADLIHAIRLGIGRDGRSLAFMPSYAFHSLSDRDVAAIVAYLRQVAPVDRILPHSRPGPLGRVLHVLGFPLLPAECIDKLARVSTPEPAVSIAYGRYLTTVAGCHACHGPALAGGSGPGPSITPGALPSWTEQDLRRALREGKRPDGTTLSAEMPWRTFGRMTDDEIAAVWLYLRSIPAVPRAGEPASRAGTSRCQPVT